MPRPPWHGSSPAVFVCGGGAARRFASDRHFHRGIQAKARAFGPVACLLETPRGCESLPITWVQKPARRAPKSSALTPLPPPVTFSAAGWTHDPRAAEESDHDDRPSRCPRSTWSRGRACQGPGDPDHQHARSAGCRYVRFNVDDMSEFMSMEHLHAAIQGIFPAKRDGLPTNVGGPF